VDDLAEALQRIVTLAGGGPTQRCHIRPVARAARRRYFARNKAETD
jgi:hypothetical protein